MVNCNAGSTDSNTVRTVIFVERLYHVLNVFLLFRVFYKFNSFPPTFIHLWLRVVDGECNSGRVGGFAVAAVAHQSPQQCTLIDHRLAAVDRPFHRLRPERPGLTLL